MHKDLVSIIVLTHSRFDMFIQSFLLLQETKKDETFDLEVVVFDNASKEPVQNNIKTLLNKFPHAKYVRSDENLAYAYANEEAIKHAAGNYYCFFNDDVMAINHSWLKEMLSCMRRHKDAGLVGAKLLYPDHTIQHAGVCFHSNGNPFHIHNGEKGRLKEANKEKQFQALTFACVLVKKETHDKIDGFEKLGRKFEYYVEDFDYCLRAVEAGYEVWYCPKAELIHHCSSTAKEVSISEESTNRHMKRFIEKWKDKVIKEDD